MAKPFKFRFVNEIVGTFVLLVVALLVAGIILAGHAQEWFTPVERIQVDFPVEGSLGIQQGASVEILGASVGKVERIRVGENGRMTGVATVKGDFIRFVRTDSQAIVKKRYSVAGEAFLEITEGRGDALPLAGRLAVTKDTELLEMLTDMLDQIRDTTVPAIRAIQVTADEYESLAADLRDPEGPLFKLLANLEAITAGLEKGEGPAGKLLRDPEMANELTAILQSVNAALEDLKRTTAQLPAMAATVGGEVQDLPGLVLQTQETLRETERLIEGIQDHWLIRKHVPQPQSSALIPVEEVTVP